MPYTFQFGSKDQWERHGALAVGGKLKLPKDYFTKKYWEDNKDVYVAAGMDGFIYCITAYDEAKAQWLCTWEVPDMIEEPDGEEPILFTAEALDNYWLGDDSPFATLDADPSDDDGEWHNGNGVSGRAAAKRKKKKAPSRVAREFNEMAKDYFTDDEEEEAEAEPPEEDPTAGDFAFNGTTAKLADGVNTWRECDPAEKPAERVYTGGSPKFEPSSTFRVASWVRPYENMPFLRFWIAFLPIPLISMVVAAMNTRGAEDYPHDWAELDEHDFIMMHICFFYMRLHPGLERSRYWSTTTSNRAQHAHALGRWLPRSKFVRMLYYLGKGVLPQYSAAVEGMSTDPLVPMECAAPRHIDIENDPFALTRRWIDALKRQVMIVFTPGMRLVVDETMLTWLSQFLNPGFVVIFRKPDSVGFELITMVCAITGIMCGWDLAEGKDADKTKPFRERYAAHVAYVLTMVAPYANTGRTVIGDSRFASVTCALVLLSLGFYCVMNVKTATKYFPKAELVKWAAEAPRGAFKSLESKGVVTREDGSSREGIVYATATVGPVGGRSNTYMVHTTGGIGEGAPRKYTRHRRNADGTRSTQVKHITQSEAACEYRSHFHRVDGHNAGRCDGGIAAVHDVWGTHLSLIRAYSELTMGVAGENAYKAWLHFGDGRGRKDHSHRAFFEGLVDDAFDFAEKRAAHNERPPSCPPSRPPSRASCGAASVPAAADSATRATESALEVHALGPISLKKPCPKRTCCVCKTHKTTFFCLKCRAQHGSKASVWVCHPNTGRGCHQEHIRNGFTIEGGKGHGGVGETQLEELLRELQVSPQPTTSKRRRITGAFDTPASKRGGGGEGAREGRKST